MTTEVEKMYENAEINKIGIKRCSGIKQGICQHNCNGCESFDYKYPPFTAEKQLKLIKWLARHNFVVCKNLGGWHTGINPTYDEEFGITCSKRATDYGSFEYALASLINTLWQDLTEEEHKQIKEILR